MFKLCPICLTEFKTYDKSQKHCSKKCMGISQKGKNNPNYGNRWTDEQKSIQSDLKVKQYNEIENYRFKAGSSNRGVKFSEERIKKMHENRNPDSYKHPHTENNKKIIGKKSKEKWTDNYKKNHRKIMEDLGHWVPISKTHPYRIYYKESNWIERMIDFFDDVALDRLNKFGIFSKANSKGFVRDHIVPRKIGFEFNLPVYILRHPANLQFISHAENISKGFSDRRLTEKEKEVIIKALFERILCFQKFWKEQDICVLFIKERRLF